MRLLVFLHGTTIMHPDEARLRDFASYVPVGGAVAKLRRWAAQGAEIAYLSAHRDPADAEVLRRNGFPPGRILAREPGETYGEVAARELPDLLIEDDCASIGADEIASTQIPAEARGRIASIVVPEFGGIDHLPDSLEELLSRARASS